MNKFLRCSEFSEDTEIIAESAKMRFVCRVPSLLLSLCVHWVQLETEV